MKAFWKSKRFYGLVITVIGAFPTVSSPIWAMLGDAGLSDEWVARGQLVSMVAGLVLTAYGSAVADKRWALK